MYFVRQVTTFRRHKHPSRILHLSSIGIQHQVAESCITKSMLCGRNSQLCNFCESGSDVEYCSLGSRVQQHLAESVLHRDYLKISSELKASTSKLYPILLTGLSQRIHDSNLHLAFTIFRLNKLTYLLDFRLLRSLILCLRYPGIWC